MNVIEWRKDAHHQGWLWDNAALEGHLHIVILGLPSRTWLWLPIDVITIAFEWILERCTPPRLTVGQYVLKPKDSLHRMSMGDKSNIIDEAEIFIFTIWLDELRRIYWEEHWAYNHEPFTTSCEMHTWTTG
jgi:hypothetical protein